MTFRHIPALILTPLFFLSACGPATTAVDCGDGESFEAGGETYCVYRSAITEEGFTCPSDVSTGRRLEGLVVCSSGGGEIPAEFFDALPGRFPDEPLPTGECVNVLCDLDSLCRGGSCAVPQTEETCLDACGDGCPAPGEQPCASDGQNYCNTCTIECKGLTVAEDASTCDQQTEQECLDACGDGCPALEFQPCASDGELYCNGCTIECKGLTVEADSSTCTE